MNFKIDRNKLLIALLLVAATIAVYGQVAGHRFVNLDDNVYVTENPYVAQGLTAEGILWAFTNFHADFWHPLTWLTHMLDVELYGLWAGGHHLTNLLLHLANTVLLFLVLAAMTGANGRSAAVAALFALHPLHVESVAWVAERKDVLSTFFFMLTLLAYVKFSRQGSGCTMDRHSFLCAGPHVEADARHPASYPDASGHLAAEAIGPSCTGKAKGCPLHLLEEKVPLLAIGFLFGIVAIVAQIKSGQATPFAGGYPLWVRVVNALASYGSYLALTVWPSGLVPFYPHLGEQVPLWKAGLSLAALSAAGAKFALSTGAGATHTCWWGFSLVSHHDASRHRDPPGGLACHGRPLHLHPPHRYFHHGGLGDHASRREKAIGGARRPWPSATGALAWAR